MSKVMRVVPALFVGRRSLVMAQKICEGVELQSGYRCGACDEVILSDQHPNMMDVVVKCQCGEYNQI
jgi:hypothetical protein